jgi:hypothetical protein
VSRLAAGRVDVDRPGGVARGVVPLAAALLTGGGDGVTVAAIPPVGVPTLAASAGNGVAGATAGRLARW